MSYLVLARKYRPQTFEQVIEQAHITRTLTNAIATDRVARLFVRARANSCSVQCMQIVPRDYRRAWRRRF